MSMRSDKNSKRKIQGPSHVGVTRLFRDTRPSHICVMRLFYDKVQLARNEQVRRTIDNTKNSNVLQTADFRNSTNYEICLPARSHIHDLTSSIPIQMRDMNKRHKLGERKTYKDGRNHEKHKTCNQRPHFRHVSYLVQDQSASPRLLRRLWALRPPLEKAQSSHLTPATRHSQIFTYLTQAEFHKQKF